MVKTGFKAATTERDIVLGWWSQWPDANIGIRTGMAFDVLDLDGQEGYDAWMLYLRSQEAYPYVHSGPVSRTGKGYHLLFAPTGLGNRTKLLDAPIDYRGIGGYIVAPPSVHPLGHRYLWDQERHRTEKAPLSEAPGWLTDLLGSETKAEPAKPLAIVNHRAPASLPERVLTQSGLINQMRQDIYEVATSLGLDPQFRTGYAVVRCPFHQDNTPSLQLDPSDNHFHCYGCGAHGDSIDLAKRRDMNGKTF